MDRRRDDGQTTDRQDTVPKARPIVRSAKNLTICSVRDIIWWTQVQFELQPTEHVTIGITAYHIIHNIPPLWLGEQPLWDLGRTLTTKSPNPSKGLGDFERPLWKTCMALVLWVVTLQGEPLTSDKASDSDGTSQKIWLSPENFRVTFVISNEEASNTCGGWEPQSSATSWGSKDKLPKFIGNCVNTFVLCLKKNGT